MPINIYSVFFHFGNSYKDRTNLIFDIFQWYPLFFYQSTQKGDTYKMSNIRFFQSGFNFAQITKRKKGLENTPLIEKTLKRRNGILLPKLFWPTVRKNCSSDREKLLKFEAEGREFAKFLRSLEQQWKVRTIFGNRILNLFLEVSHI